MSQAKVDKYKKEKSNRKATMRKEKISRVFGRIVAWAILAAIVVWAGATAYTYYENSVPAKTHVADLTSINDYVSGLDTEAE